MDLLYSCSHEIQSRSHTHFRSMLPFHSHGYYRLMILFHSATPHGGIMLLISILICTYVVAYSLVCAHMPILYKPRDPHWTSSSLVLLVLSLESSCPPFPEFSDKPRSQSLVTIRLFQRSNYLYYLSS